MIIATIMMPKTMMPSVIWACSGYWDAGSGIRMDEEVGLGFAEAVGVAVGVPTAKV
jgi:hypothetical protein